MGNLRSHPQEGARRKLLLVGDGPELATAYKLARGARQSRRSCTRWARKEEVVPLLSSRGICSCCRRRRESFGLAALEAMACEVPVVASRVGGLPEVIDHGVTGFLHPLDALDEDGGQRA